MPKRKSIRLKDYDYSRNGAYFVTICAESRQNIFGEIVGTDDPVRPFAIRQSHIGDIVIDCWEAIDSIYNNVKTDKFVIMPNHFHGIVIISGEAGGQSRPPLHKVIQGFKSVTARRCFPLGYKTIWQRSFHDHIIRDEQDYLRIWQYIDENPQKWQEDCYYIV